MAFLFSIIKKFIRSYNIPINLENIRSVLIVDPNHIGDMLMASPVYRALKMNIRGAKVDSLVYPFTKVALKNNPFIDNIFPLPRGLFLKQFVMILKLRRNNYDLVMQLSTSMRTNFLMWLIGKRYRLGYDYAHRGFLNNIRVPIAARAVQSQYRVDECVALLEKAFGWEITQRQMIFPVEERDINKIRDLLIQNDVSDNDVIIGIHSNCRSPWIERRWETHKFAKLANILIDQYNYKVIFTGSQEDFNYVSNILKEVDHSQDVINLVGKISLTELGALLKRINVFITVNTAPMQIAVSQNTPTVALIGATNPIVTYPVGNPVFQYICGKSTKYNDQSVFYPKDLTRMKSITIDEVLSRVVYLLECQKQNVNFRYSNPVPENY